MDDISGKYNKIRSNVVNRDMLTTNNATLIENKSKIEDIAPSKFSYVCNLIINAVISIISFITPLKLRFKTSPVIDASNIGNGFYLPCPLNKHIKSTRYRVDALAQNRINHDMKVSYTDHKDSAMYNSQVKHLVVHAFEKSYDLAKKNSKEDFVLIIDILGYNEYPELIDNNQLTYDEFINLFYAEVHNQQNLFQALDNSINFQIYVNFPEEANSKRTNLAINQANASYNSISNDVYVSNIKQYIQSYKNICERSIRETEGRNIVSDNQINIDHIQPKYIINVDDSEFPKHLKEDSDFFDNLDASTKQLLTDLQQVKLHADKFSDIEIFDKYIKLFYLLPDLQPFFKEKQLKNGNYELKLDYYFSITIKNKEIIKFLSSNIEDKIDMLIRSIAHKKVRFIPNKKNYQSEIKINTFLDFLVMMKEKDNRLNTRYTNTYSFDQLINEGGVLAILLIDNPIVDSARHLIENRGFSVNLNNPVPELPTEDVATYREITGADICITYGVKISSLLLSYGVITEDERNRFNIVINNDVIIDLLNNFILNEPACEFTKIVNFVDSEINLPFSLFKTLFGAEGKYLIDPEYFSGDSSQEEKHAFVLALSKLFSHINLKQYDNLTRKDELLFIHALFANIKNMLTVKLPENQQLEVNKIMLDTLVYALIRIKNINDFEFLNLVEDDFIIDLIDKLDSIISDKDDTSLDEQLYKDNSFIVLLVYYAEHCNKPKICDKTRILYKKYISSKYNLLKEAKDFTSIFGNMSDGNINFDEPKDLNYMFKKEEKTILLSDQLISDLLNYPTQKTSFSFVAKVSIFIGEELIPPEQLPIADIFTKDLLVFKTLYEEINSGATEFIGLILDLIDEPYRDYFISALNNPYGISNKIDINDTLSSFAKYLTDNLRSLTDEHFLFLSQHFKIKDNPDCDIARTFVIIGLIMVKFSSKGALGTEETAPEMLRLYAAALFDKAYKLDKNSVPKDFYNGESNSWSMRLRGELNYPNMIELCGDCVYNCGYSFIQERLDYESFINNLMPVNWR
jgi:hypothetical protein